MAKRRTRRDELDEAAESVGLYIRTYSPGDGATRYRFFEKMSRTCECGDVFHAHRNCDYQNLTAEACQSGHSEGSKIPRCGCKQFRATPSNSNYFGPESGIETVLGAEHARIYLRGRGAMI